MKKYKKLSYETNIDKIKQNYQVNKEQIHKNDKQLYECQGGSNILRLQDTSKQLSMSAEQVTSGIYKVINRS